MTHKYFDNFKEIQKQILKVQNTNIENGVETSKDYWSWALNLGFDNGYKMGGNYEKYLIDVDFLNKNRKKIWTKLVYFRRNVPE